MVAKLTGGQRLALNTHLSSPNGGFKLWMQNDGNLVLYDIEGAIWSSHTNGKPVNECIMQNDGNLVLYTPDGALWSSHTNGNPGSILYMQNDGNVVIYDKNDTAIWSTHTSRDIHTGRNTQTVSVGKMDATVTIQSDGKTITEIHSRTGNQLQGFTGGFNAVFFDKDGRCIAETPLRTIGVTPDIPLVGDHHERRARYTDNLSPDVYNKTIEIGVALLHTPSTRWSEYERAVRIGKGIAEIYATFAAA
jgi:hypothetical protein